MSTTPRDITYFNSAGARSKTEAKISLLELRDQILNTQAESKAELPWLKLAKFGAVPTAKGSLRHDANVIAVTGCEADYDGGQISFDEAFEQLEKAGVKALIYTSPSHEPDKPRWRVLAPFSTPLPPAERDLMVRRLNGIFAGKIADESFTLSQSYYFGHLYEAAEYFAEITDGQEIDLCPELDRGAIGKSNRTRAGNGEDQEGPIDQFDIAKAFELLASGESCHPQVMSILASYAARGVPREALVLMTQNFVGFHQRYHGRLNEMLRMIDWVCTKETKKAQNKPDTERQLRGQIPPGETPHEPIVYAWHDTSPWSTMPPPAPRWVVQDILPRGEVCLFSGDGGTGKSTIALHAAAGVGLGMPWLSFPVTQGPTMFVDAEDHTDVIWRRADALAGNYGVGIADITDNLHILSLKGQDAVLASFAKNGVIMPSELFLWIKAEAVKIRPALIVIASSANVFAGNENDRSHTTQFAANLLGGLALEADACVILIAHPPKNTGADYSGSTAWHAAVRARMSLDKAGDNGIRQLVFPKNQYGPDHDALTLEWRNGLFLPIPGAGSYEQAAKDQKTDTLFLTLLQKLLSHGTKLSPSEDSRTYAPHVMAKMDEAKGTTKKELKAAMERAEAKGTIRLVTVGIGTTKERVYVALASG